METKKFHLSAVLTVVTHKYMCSDVNELYQILNFMTGDSVYSTQLARVLLECEPEILLQHPQLKEVNGTEITTENCAEWLADKISKYGEYLPINTLVINLHEFKNPIEEYEEKYGDKKIITVKLPVEKKGKFDPSLN